MTTRTFPTLPGCGRGASVRIEMYSTTANSGAHGSLDGAGYACAEHLDLMVAAVFAAGFTPYVSRGTESAAGSQCGAGYDFVAKHAVNAPEPEHPSWCARKPNEDGTHDCHSTGYIEVEHPNDSVVVEAELWSTVDRETGRSIMLRITEEGEARTYPISLEQAGAFGAVLIRLAELGREGGAR